MAHNLLTLLFHWHLLAVSQLAVGRCILPSFYITEPSAGDEIPIDDFYFRWNDYSRDHHSLCPDEYIFVIASQEVYDNPCKYRKRFSLTEDDNTHEVLDSSFWWEIQYKLYRFPLQEDDLPAISDATGLEVHLVLFNDRVPSECDYVSVTLLPPGRDTSTSSSSDSESDSDGTDGISTMGDGHNYPTSTTTSLQTDFLSESDTTTTTSAEEDEPPGQGDKGIEDEHQDQGDHGLSAADKGGIGSRVTIGVPLLAVGVYWLVKLIRQHASAA